MIRRSKKTAEKPADPQRTAVAVLLRKAQRSEESARFCGRMRDDAGERAFTRRQQKALADALALDPNKESPDWESVT